MDSNLNDRLNSVRDTVNEKKLKRYALDDPSPQVREIAVSKIKDPVVLSYIIQNDEDENVAMQAVKNLDDEYELKSIAINLIENRSYPLPRELILEIIEKITNVSYLMEIGTKGFTEIILDKIYEINPKILFKFFPNKNKYKITTNRLELVNIVSNNPGDWKFRVITNQEILVDIALNNEDSNMRADACKHITNQNLLVEIALNDKSSFVRRVACDYITNQETLKEIALNDKDEDVKKNAVNHITNQELLKEIALNSDDYWNVVRHAINRIINQDILNELILAGNRNLKDVLRHVSTLSHEHYGSRNDDLKLEATEHIANQDMLIELALNESYWHIHDEATARLDEETRVLYQALKKEGV